MKNTIIGIIIGICLTVTALHVWYLYKLNNAVVQNSNAIGQIVQFINSNIDQQPTVEPKVEE